MAMLIADCRHGNVAVSARSVQPVVNGNAGVSEAVPDEAQEFVRRRPCQTVPYDVLWRRLDISSSEQTSLDELAADEEVDGEELRSLVARQRCTSLKHDHHQHHHQRHHRHRRLRRRAAHLCQLQKCRLRMRDDVFPAHVESGRCVGARTCLFGLYECVARRHTVKLLRRLPPDEALGCLPVPTVSSDSVYKDAWVPFDFQVTVACECSRRSDSGVYTN